MNPLRLAQLFFMGCLLTIGVSQLLLKERKFVPRTAAPLAGRLPARIGAWTEVPTEQDVVDPSNSGAQDSANQLYDSISYHTYRRGDGTQVILALAYRRVQEQESKIHRPELCYFAQGFVISHPETAAVRIGAKAIRAVTFRAQSPQRDEAVVYWIRIGDIISTSAWQTRLYLAKLGLRQRVPDGLLVRASIESQSGTNAVTKRANIQAITQFLGELVKTAGNNRTFLAGAA